MRRGRKAIRAAAARRFPEGARASPGNGRCRFARRTTPRIRGLVRAGPSGDPEPGVSDHRIERKPGEKQQAGIPVGAEQLQRLLRILAPEHRNLPAEMACESRKANPAHHA